MHQFVNAAANVFEKESKSFENLAKDYNEETIVLGGTNEVILTAKELLALSQDSNNTIINDSQKVLEWAMATLGIK